MIGSEEKGKTEEQLSIVYEVHVVPAELLWKCLCVLVGEGVTSGSL